MTSLLRWGSGGTADGVDVMDGPAPDVGPPADGTPLDRSPGDPACAQTTAIEPATTTGAMSTQSGNRAFDAWRPGDTRGSSSLGRWDQGSRALDVVGDGSH